MSNETSSFRPNTSTLPALVAQFRQHYPMGALVSELLTLHQDSYVVRASVQVGSVLVSTGMAAASTIEAAEDRAKERALQGIGLSQTIQPSLFGRGSAFSTVAVPSSLTAASPPDAPSSVSSFSIPSTEPLSDPGAPPLPRSTSPIPPSESLPEAEPEPSLDFSTSLPLETEVPAASRSPKESPSLPEPAAPKKAKSAKITKSKPAGDDLPLDPTLDASEPQDAQDYSDIIAKIDVEMMRLGWNASKGREHLKSVYGKRSRQQLSYPELLDFLAYLEAQSFS